MNQYLEFDKDKPKPGFKTVRLTVVVKYDSTRGKLLSANASEEPARGTWDGHQSDSEVWRKHRWSLRRCGNLDENFRYFI